MGVALSGCWPTAPDGPSPLPLQKAGGVAVHGKVILGTFAANIPTITYVYSCLALVTTRKAGKAYDQHVQGTFY